MGPEIGWAHSMEPRTDQSICSLGPADEQLHSALPAGSCDVGVRLSHLQHDVRGSGLHGRLDALEEHDSCLFSSIDMSLDDTVYVVWQVVAQYAHPFDFG